MKRFLAALSFTALSIVPAALSAAPIAVVAAEKFYGEAARAIGGEYVAVDSVLVAPGTDPHDYEPTPSVARAVSDADVIVLNGADYDHWMEDLIAATATEGRAIVNVATLIGVAEGDNPHLWYHPAAMPAAARALAAAFSKVDPAHAADYEKNRDAYLATLAPIAAKVADVRARFAGAAVVATEPVFGQMTDALGLKMQNEAFQTAIMNESEPAARDVAAIEDAIRNREVKVLFYNAQVEDAFTLALKQLAAESGVPTVSVTETQPEGKTFAEWLIESIDATAQALGKAAS